VQDEKYEVKKIIFESGAETGSEKMKTTKVKKKIIRWKTNGRGKERRGKYT
jgi:hypothetical protein